MPISSKTLTTLTRECTFDYLGETVHVTYYPSAFGPEAMKTGNRVQAALNSAVASGDDAAAEQALLETGAWLCTILAKWDYLEDDGVTMQPITPENLAKQLVEFSDFMQAVVAACRNDRNQGNANGTPSSAPSAATSLPMENSASMAVSQTPSDSSSLPDGSMEPPPSNGS